MKQTLPPVSVRGTRRPDQPLGSAGHPAGRRPAGVPGRGQPRISGRRWRSSRPARSRSILRNLPDYAARTTLAHAGGAGAVAAVHLHLRDAGRPRAGAPSRLLVPLLDILQSVPILGFISITVVFFMSLAPGRVLGAEFAAIFAIFTSQAWNMAFSFYQSLRTVPTELREAADIVPALAVDALLAARGAVRHAGAHLEHDDVDVGRLVLRGRRRRPSASATPPSTLPGRRLLHRAGDRAAQPGARSAGRSPTMFVVILLYDQLLFRPLVAWADRFRFEQEAGGRAAALLGADHDAPLAPPVRLARAVRAPSGDELALRPSARPRRRARAGAAARRRARLDLALVRGAACSWSALALWQHRRVRADRRDRWREVGARRRARLPHHAARRSC